MKAQKLTENEVISCANEWHSWMARNGAAPEPSFSADLDTRSYSLKNILATVLIHLPLSLLFRVSYSCRLFRLAIGIAKLRVASDSLSFEPQQCGLNNAYCNLGLAYVAQGNIHEAAACLNKAWRVYPCPHNTSFGLKMKLCRQLAKYPEAQEVVARYKHIAGEFVAQQFTQAGRP